jgi:hypothetical protein
MKTTKEQPCFVAISRDSTEQPFEGQDGGQIPSIACAQCQRQVGVSATHATLTVNQYSACGGKVSKKPIALSELKSIESRLKRKHGFRGELSPGAWIGAWTFRRKSNERWRDCDVYWGDPGGMLWNPELMKKVLSAGFKIESELVTLKCGRTKEPANWHHIEVPILDVLHRTTFKKKKCNRCDTCGFIEATDAFFYPGKDLWLDRSKTIALPSIFAPKSFEDCYVVSAELAKCLQSLGATGLEYESNVWIV